MPGGDHDTAKIANLFVANLWEAIPDLIAGKKGRKPSNFALAVGAMTNGLHRTKPGSEAEDAVFLALGSLLQTQQAVKAAASNEADAFLIEAGASLYMSKGHEKGLLAPEELAT